MGFDAWFKGIPKPGTPDERIFTTAYRFSPIRRAMTRVFVPLGFSVMITFPLLTYMIRRGMIQGREIEPEILTQLNYVLGALGLVGVSMGVALLITGVRIRRIILDSYVRFNQSALVSCIGGKMNPIKWESVEKVRTFSLGRIQTCSVKGGGTTCRFDASYVDAYQPVPRIKLTLAGEKLIFPDERGEKRLAIRENELYRLVREMVNARKETVLDS